MSAGSHARWGDRRIRALVHPRGQTLTPSYPALCPRPTRIRRACLIVFQNIVPISLVITVEMVKTLQAIFIYQDIDMWYEPVSRLPIPPPACCTLVC